MAKTHVNGSTTGGSTATNDPTSNDTYVAKPTGRRKD